MISLASTPSASVRTVIMHKFGFWIAGAMFTLAPLHAGSFFLDFAPATSASAVGEVSVLALLGAGLIGLRVGQVGLQRDRARRTYESRMRRLD